MKLSDPALRPTERSKIVSAADAVQLIHDGDTLATSGFVGIGFAEQIAIALEQRFVSGPADRPDAGLRVQWGAFFRLRRRGFAKNRRLKK